MEAIGKLLQQNPESPIPGLGFRDYLREPNLKHRKQRSVG